MKTEHAIIERNGNYWQLERNCTKGGTLRKQYSFEVEALDAASDLGYKVVFVTAVTNNTYTYVRYLLERHTATDDQGVYRTPQG